MNEDNNDLLSELRLRALLYMLSHPPAVPREIKKKQKKLKPLYKFSVKNEIAYTEDHIPVQKLHLFGLPMELTQDALLEYFTQNFVQNVVIERIEDSVPADEEQEYLPSWSAFALFAHASDAAKVLLNSEHLVNSHKFHVQPCYSWLQPYAVEESNELELAMSSLILGKLNDDCLECVFQYLPLADQIRLARVCFQFRNIYQRFSARQHKSICSERTKDLTLWEAHEFCQLSGHHVHSLSLSQWRCENFKRCFYTGLHFPHLKRLILHDSQLKVHKLQRILMGTNKLKELTVTTERTIDPLELAHLQELKNLEISEWNTESLSLPTSIESLTLNEWREFSCLPQILRDHTCIKKLHVYESANVFKDTARSQTFASVEVLKISYSGFDGEELIAQLPKLKKLCLHFNYIFPEVIPEIVKHYSHQLDHFEISSCQEFYKEDVLRITRLSGLHTLVLSNPDEIDEDVISAFSKLTKLKRFGLSGSNITDSLVIKLLINCPKLSKLRMEECSYISDNLEHSIISLLRKDIQRGKNQRELPFKLYLNDFCDQTDNDVFQVDFGENSMSEWFDEELKVNN